MSGVRHLTVAADEADLRVDRWFRRRFPELPHGRLQKLLRKGEVRLDGKRVDASDRVQEGQTVRVPPFGELEPARAAEPRQLSDADVDFIRNLVIYEDDAVIALDKPAGLAVQGGTGTQRHVDGLLAGLVRRGDDKPRLVHRLDRDTSGVLLVAKSSVAAHRLARNFAGRVRKLYWAITVGTPNPARGRIEAALAKGADGAGVERMGTDAEDGKDAVTDYVVVERAGAKLAFVALQPHTGRTHQLRVHMLHIGCPILGDGKYGGANAFVQGLDLPRQLHLHARRLRVAHPTEPRELDLKAPPPAHMRRTFAELGFAPGDADPFDDETFRAEGRAGGRR